MPSRLASVLALAGLGVFSTAVLQPSALIGQEAAPSAVAFIELTEQMAVLEETLILDISLARAEFLGHAWPAPDISVELLAPGDGATAVGRYLEAVIAAQDYLNRSEAELDRLALHIGFWDARIVREDAALLAMSELISAVVENDPGRSDLVRFATLLSDRRTAFVEVRDRYVLAVTHVKQAYDSINASSDALITLAQFQSSVPPGLEAFAMSDLIAQGMETTAATKLAELTVLGQQRIMDLQYYEEALRRSMQDEAERLAPLNEVQKVLSIVQLVLQAYQVQAAWRAEFAAPTAVPTATTDAKPTTGAEIAVDNPDPVRNGATGSFLTRQDLIDKLAANLQELGAPPTETEMQAMSATDLAAYANQVDKTIEMLRTLEPSSADGFAERYVFEGIDLPDADSWTRGQGVMDFLSIVLRPQVVHDGTPGGLAHREDMWRQLAPHQRLVEFMAGGPDARDLMLMPTYPALIDRSAGPTIRPVD